MAHLASWMYRIWLDEYNSLEVGYYDLTEDKACPYLKQNFPKAKETET
jgi:hypothetical protein